MDFLDPNKKKAHIRRLYIGYILVGVAIALVAYLMVVLSNGYDLDRKTGKVIQNGLIYVASAPEKTTAFLDGKAQGTTDRRLTVPEGHYTVEMKRTGYDNWRKSIDLEGGTIERLTYPRLFPTKLTTAQSKVYAGTPSLWTQSPDRHWLVVGHPGSMTDFDVYNDNDPTQEATIINLPSTVLTAAKTKAVQTLTLVEWSNDNRHVLVEHGFDGLSEFIMIDTNTPRLSVNLNTLLAINPTTVTLRDKRFDKLYVYTAASKLLQLADTKTKKLTLVASSVVAYKSYSDNVILYAAEDTKLPGKVAVRLIEDAKTYNLVTYPTTSLLLEMASFDNHTYVAVAPINTHRLYIFKDPLSRLKKDPPQTVSPYAVMKITNPGKIAFSSNTRFLSAQSKATFAVYDFEEDRRYTFTVQGVIAADQFAKWMDGHRLILNQNSTVQVFEFDGQNQRSLGAVMPNTPVFYDRNYQRQFTLTPDSKPGQVAINRTSLKLKVKP